MTPFDQMKAKRRLAEERRQEAVAFFGESRTFRPEKIKPNKVSRPSCAYCGKPYGERAIQYEQRKFAIGEPIPPYHGNAHLVCEEVMVGDEMGPNLTPGATLRRQTWDGESFRSRSGTDPFCTSACAIDFAKAAHRAGYRMKH